MTKGTMLDRLTEAIGTLKRRPSKGLTPRQRVANAQHWNSINEIAEHEDNRLYDNWMNNKSVYNEPDELLGRPEFEEFHEGIYRLGLPDEGATGANPFLSRIPEKYHEQDNFLYWCTKNGYEPTEENLKRYRWEEYQTLPYRQRQWIANKDVIKPYLSSETGFGYDEELFDEIEALPEFQEYLQDRHLQEFPTYKSMDEFPDDFDYMWRY